MRILEWTALARLLVLAALACLPGIAAAQLPEQSEASRAAAEAFGQNLNKQEQSEWINLKTYSDEEWQSAVAAVAANLAACDTGDAVACKTAGDAYVSGDGVWPVPAIAFILYKEACDAGVGAGCRAFVELANSGYGYPEGGYEEAEGLLEKACDLGDLIGCDAFASELRQNGPEPSDIARSDAVLENACTAGGEEACLSLSTLLMNSGRPEDYDRAAKLLDGMCRNAVLPACQMMADRSEYKEEPDEALIARYAHLSCDLGSASDCIDIGQRTYRGNGIAEDRDLAMAYFDKACQIESEYCKTSETLRALPALQSACTPDDAQACAQLGRALAYSLTPEYDPETAGQLLISACRQSLGDACLDANEIMRWNSDLRQSATTSEMLERGCDADNLDACLQLAGALEGGGRGTTDVERVAGLYNRLCDLGSLEACDRASLYAGPDASGLPAPLPVLQGSRLSYETEICFTQSEIFRGKTYAHENCPRTEKGIRSNRALRNEAPWQALLWRPKVLNGKALGVTQRVACGGTLIATGWVLTAAHCLTDDKTNVLTAGHRIRLGVFNPQIDEGISYPILRTFPHPQYDASENYVFDIALIQYDPRAGRVGRANDAESERRRNAVTPVTLDPLDVGQRRIVTGMPAYSYGWGWTETKNSKSSNYLQIVAMEMKSEKACTAQTRFVNEMGDAALCVGGRNGAQMCYGDSGGPLVLYSNRGAQAILIGVVSAGKKCGETGLPSQYTRVAKVKSWIEKTIAQGR